MVSRYSDDERADIQRRAAEILAGINKPPSPPKPEPPKRDYWQAPQREPAREPPQSRTLTDAEAQSLRNDVQALRGGLLAQEQQHQQQLADFAKNIFSVLDAVFASLDKAADRFDQLNGELKRMRTEEQRSRTSPLDLPPLPLAKRMQ